MKSASLQWILGPIPHEGITHGNIFMFHEQNEVYRIMFMVIDFNGPFNRIGISPSRPIMVAILGNIRDTKSSNPINVKLVKFLNNIGVVHIVANTFQIHI